MATLLGMARLVVTTLPQVLLSGWAAALLLVAVLLAYLQYRRIATTESELHGVALHPALEQTQQALLAGVAAGVAGSFVLTVAGVGLAEMPGTASALLYLWPVSLLLGAVNPRFYCFAYAATLVSICRLVTGWPNVEIPSLLGLVAALHMVEALLILMNGAAGATPVSLAGKAGDPVPGFALQRFWPVPLVLPLFTPETAQTLTMPAWWPLIGSEAMGAGALGWQLIPAVVTMGYSDLAITAPPARRARQSSLVLLAYSAILLLLSAGAARFAPLLWAAALFSGFGHEAMAVWSGQVQLRGLPYLRRPERGVGVLDVVPGSPAYLAGLRSGAVILAVDDYEVHSRSQLHELLLSSQAYVRLMYRNDREVSHTRLPRPEQGFLGLGVITLPEHGDPELATMGRPAFFRWFGLER